MANGTILVIGGHLKKEAQERQAIRAALIESENSGEPVDGKESFACLRRELGLEPRHG